MRRRASPQPKRNGCYVFWCWLVVITLALLLISSAAGCVQHHQCPPIPPPGPSPEPTPEPETPPLAARGIAYVVLIHEQKEITLEQAALLNDLAFWRGLRARGIRYRFLDDDLAVARPYVRVLARAKVEEPALILMDAKGTVLSVAELPKDSAGVAALIESHRGNP